MLIYKLFTRLQPPPEKERIKQKPKTMQKLCSNKKISEVIMVTNSLHHIDHWPLELGLFLLGLSELCPLRKPVILL